MAHLPLPDEGLLRTETLARTGLDLHVRYWGDHTKPAVLLLHGGKDHGRSWDWTVRQLMDKYFVVVPDLRGHGDSAWAPGGGYEMPAFIMDLAAIVEHLLSAFGCGPIHLVGHSLGGNISLHFSAAFPEHVRSLTAIEGLGFSQKSYDDVTAKPKEQRLREAALRMLKIHGRTPRRFDDEGEGIARLAKLHQQLDPQQAEHLARHALRRFDDGFGWKHDPLLGFMPVRPEPPSEYSAVYGAIAAPVLLLYGQDSWASSPKDDGRIEVFSSVHYEEFQDAGHWLHHDQFGQFISVLMKFLESQA